jgi:hypothetical protein
MEGLVYPATGYSPGEHSRTGGFQQRTSHARPISRRAFLPGAGLSERPAGAQGQDHGYHRGLSRPWQLLSERHASSGPRRRRMVGFQQPHGLDLLDMVQTLKPSHLYCLLQPELHEIDEGFSEHRLLSLRPARRADAGRRSGDDAACESHGGCSIPSFADRTSIL